MALQALFEDNVDGETNLALDHDVTKKNFLTEIRHVANQCGPDDLAVITFSGHGTVDGELVMHDSVPDKLHETGLPLRELLEAVEQIRARQVIVVLDCCFVGGFVEGGPAWYPAKTAGPSTSEHARRGSALTPEHLVDKFSGKGRVVIAASGEGQIAYEDKWLRHGVLTHHLIQALLGRGIDVQNNRISFMTLVEHVMRKVHSNPGTIRKPRQEPVVGAVTGLMSIEMFTVGKKYESVAGDFRPPTVKPDPLALAEHGIPAAACEAWKRRVGRLTDFQVGVIDRGGVLTGESVLVGAPTSSGKTLIGEIAALNAVAAGRPAVFLVPTRALADELYDLFVRDYSSLGITILRATGGRREDVPRLLSGRFQLAVCTYEKFVGLLQATPGLLSKLGVLVLDEIQMIGVPVRGPKLELLLTRIRAGRREGRPVPQVIGLSSAPGAGRTLAEWAGMTPMTGAERLTPLQEGVVTPGGQHRLRDHDGAERIEVLAGFQHGGDEEETALHLVQRLVRENQQVIVFRARRYQAWTFAQRLAQVLGLPPAQAALDELLGGDDGRVTERLRNCLRHGVAFHVSDLSDGERTVVERAFRRPASEVRVIVATTTLAQGVNLPADCVVVHELEHPSSSDARYTVSEYKNMAGRAGRTGQVEEGRAFIIASNETDAVQKWRDYVQAAPQPLRTAFPVSGDDLRTTILSLFTDVPDGRGGFRSIDVEETLALTLASYQHRHDLADAQPFPPDEVDRALRSLNDARLLRREGQEYRLTGLGTVAMRSGLSITSVTALVRALSVVEPGDMNPITLICAAQLTTELCDNRFSGGSVSRVKGPLVFGRKLQGLGVPDHVLDQMRAADGGTDTFLSRARRAVACHMWSRGSRLVKIEGAISLQQPKQFTDPGPVRQAARRAAEVVEAALEIALEVNAGALELGELLELPTQLEFGVRAGLASVARNMEGPVERHVFLDLANARLTTAAEIVNADDDVLLGCVGGDTGVFVAVRKAAEAAIDADRDDDLDGLVD
ncbi:DEAD/DEAH box helicase [Spirillospora sp. NPDC049652]